MKVDYKNHDFITVIRRTHRMAILSKEEKLICKCGQVIDEFGDRFFKYTHHSKTSLHNHIRDTIQIITQNIEIHANSIQNKDFCLKEESGLIPNYPLLRPEHITLHSNKNTIHILQITKTKQLQ